MWALPNLSVLDAEKLAHEFDGRNLWCLLLFPNADKQIVAGLKQNWDRFSQALGTSVHVITLLESNHPNSPEGLKFPAGYEANVGKFCHDLKIRLDDLPVLFLLNAQDHRGPPYWSLRRDNPMVGSQALETLVSDICEATFNLSCDLEPEAWRNAAAANFLEKRSAHDTIRFLKAHKKDLQALVGWLVKMVKPHSPA